MKGKNGTSSGSVVVIYMYIYILIILESNNSFLKMITEGSAEFSKQKMYLPGCITEV